MSFFNKKEDVIDIELTQYGKYLLSKGKFKPEYYAFSDDEIIYNVAFSENGKVEHRKEAYERIVNNTPSTKAFYSHEGIETRVLRLNGHVIDVDGASKKASAAGKINKIPVDEIYGNDYIDETSMKPTSDALMRSKLGTSKLGDSFAPAWNISSLNNQQFSLPIEVSASSDPSMEGVPVPQLNINVDYNTYTYEAEFPVDREIWETMVETSTNFIFKDRKQLYINHQNILLDIIEENTSFDEINHEIEVYLIEEEETVEDVSGGSTRINREVQRLLCFAPIGQESSDNPNYVETYFDIKFDDDITPQEILDAKNETSKAPLFNPQIPNASGIIPINRNPGEVMYGVYDDRDEDSCE